MLAPVRNVPHASAMPCARVEHARWPLDTGDGSSTRDGGPAAPRQGRSTSDSEQGLEEGSRHALRTNPRHGRSCAWRRCRRLLTPARVELSFFRKKGENKVEVGIEPWLLGVDVGAWSRVGGPSEDDGGRTH